MSGLSEGELSRLNFVEILRERAQRTPDRRAYLTLMDGDSEEAPMTYAELDAKARDVASVLQSYARVGDRAILLFATGPEFLISFFACFYAGVVAVPVFPPHPARMERSVEKLTGIIRDSGARLIVTSDFVYGAAQQLFERYPELGALKWMTTDALNGAGADAWKDPNVGAQTLAFLQYTSGSTGTPKGVMVSHGMLTANELTIRSVFGMSEEKVVVSWLPLYHDMGLIGFALQPVFSGFPAVLMSPLLFLQQPLRWLTAITRYRGTTSGGPNFAYDLCSKRVSAEEKQALDLSSWTEALNGAEPVRADTLRRFEAAFAPCGFRWRSFFPCYGMAEATLLISAHRPAGEPIIEQLKQGPLAQGRAEPGDGGDGEGCLAVVSNGVPADWSVRIVDPGTRQVLPSRTIGEIWVSGPSAAPGYWQRPEETEHTFRAYTDAGEGPFMRTGDLGFLDPAGLFVTGRLKDLIIIAGRNHFPSDLERTVERAYYAVRPGCVAAFSVPVDGEEALVIVTEVERRYASSPGDKAWQAKRTTPLVDGADPVMEGPFVREDALRAIRAALVREHGLTVHEVVTIKAATLGKTSSGKVQRRACRDAYLAQTLERV